MTDGAAEVTPAVPGPVEPYREITSVGTYIDALKELGAGGDRPLFWFRGHSDAKYRLVPSAMRSETAQRHERAMLKRFMQDAVALMTDPPETPWAWLFLAQHHGVPTRLLDWSENALVALFFAAEEKASALEGMPRPDGDVWVLSPANLNRESGWNALHDHDVPMMGLDDLFDAYSPTQTPPAEAVLSPLAGIAPRAFQRVVNQWGTFTISTDGTPMESAPRAAAFLHRLRVPALDKAAIRAELDYLGMQERWLYPDLHRLGERVKGLFA